MPQSIYKEDVQRLFTQIQFFKPSKVLITGDMFHSNANKELDFFVKWRKDFPQTEFVLVKGNHDLLSKKFYEQADINVVSKKISVQNFCFTHDIETCDAVETEYTFSGHLHPGIKINGIGKQSMSLPCFYFSSSHAILPAFSLFTGLFKLKPKKTDTVFALVDHQVIKLQ